MAVTSNRGYPLPVAENYISSDVALLIQAYQLIDADVASIFAALAGKSPTLHGHSMGDVVGLSAALAGKAAIDHTHSLDNLADVSGAAAAGNGFVLVKSGSTWSPQPASSLAGAHTHVIGDISNLQTALDSKLAAPQIAALSLKAAVVDADSAVLVDSEAANALKRVSWASIKARLKEYFDTIYTAAGGGVQTGTIHEYGGDTAPTGYHFCFGQEASRTTDAALFAVIGTKFGAGDGSTTFNLPDKRGRVGVGKDDMGGVAANRLGPTLTGTRASASNGVISDLSSTSGLAVGMLAFGTGIAAGATIVSIDSATQVTLSANNTATGTGSIRFAVIDGNTIGAVGGSAVHALTTGQMPSHTHSGTAASAGAHTHTVTTAAGVGGSGLSTTGQQGGTASTSSAGAHTHTLAINNTGGDQAHPNIQPSIVMNFIIKR